MPIPKNMPPVLYVNAMSGLYGFIADKDKEAVVNNIVKT